MAPVRGKLVSFKAVAFANAIKKKKKKGLGFLTPNWRHINWLLLYTSCTIKRGKWADSPLLTAEEVKDFF